MRARTLCLLSVLVTVAVVAVAVLAGPARHHGAVRREVAVRSVGPPDPCVARALGVLREWDRRRARAWARADPAALADLYAGRSRTGRLDRAMLAAYHSRGLRVRSMDRQVLALRVRACTPRRISLLLTDRLVDAVAVGRGQRTGLPAGAPAIRRVDLRRDAGRWRVSEVYAR
jgi:hypothetical protein